MANPGILKWDLCISECNIPISCSSVHRCSFLGIHIFTKNATFPGKRKAWIFLVFNMWCFSWESNGTPQNAHKYPLITPAFFGAGVALGNRCFARCLRYQRNLSSICQVASLDVIPKYVVWIVSVCMAWRHFVLPQAVLGRDISFSLWEWCVYRIEGPINTNELNLISRGT